MKSPFTGKEMNIVKEEKTMTFRKEEFTVVFHTYKCEDTGEQFEDDTFAKINQLQLINQYKERNSLPFTDEIIGLRELYKVSATKMSEILGFGVNSYRQYESGEVPNLSNGKLIKLVEDPLEFKQLVKYYDIKKDIFSKDILQNIDSILESEVKGKTSNQIEEYFLPKLLPSSFTGFKTPNFKKFSQMVSFFAETLSPWKTKLNKLLFYADFEMYKANGNSISGMQYRAITMGPVPNNFNGIFEYLQTIGIVDIDTVYFPNGAIGEQFLSKEDQKFKPELFSDNELEILTSTANRFKDMSTNDIIEYSHKEDAWLLNHEERNIIDYKYSFELN